MLAHKIGREGTGKQMKRKFHIRRWLFVLFILSCGVLLVAVLRPQFFLYAEKTVQQTVNRALYDALSASIYEQRTEYAKLVVLERDSESGVTALRTDGILANRLKVQAARAVDDAIERLEEYTLSVPLGNILLPAFFAGLGPELPIGLVGLGYVETDFLSAFTSEGINQTRHQIVLEVVAQIRILSPLGARPVEVRNQLAVSDTVLVGTTPEQYTYIDDTEQDILGKVVDYGMNGD